jgi:uncharacterized membrane protein
MFTVADDLLKEVATAAGRDRLDASKVVFAAQNGTATSGSAVATATPHGRVVSEREVIEAPTDSGSDASCGVVQAAHNDGAHGGGAVEGAACDGRVLGAR